MVFSFEPLDDEVHASMVNERVLAVLSTCFGALGLLLAPLGLYCVTASAVIERRGEIGIVVAALAAWLPASRAARVDPAQVLRTL